MSISILDFQLSNMILSEFEQKMTTPNREKIVYLILLIIFALANNVLAGYGFKLDGTLDKEEISRSYFEGDFSKVLPPLETYRANFPHGIVAGSKVKRGQIIGYVGKLNHIKQSMLHFELYSSASKKLPLTDYDKPNFYRRSDNINPTQFLDELSFE